MNNCFGRVDILPSKKCFLALSWLLQNLYKSLFAHFGSEVLQSLALFFLMKEKIFQLYPIEPTDSL